MNNSDFFNMLINKHGINLNEQQRTAAVHEKGPCLLLAVPGGGKTTTMLCRTAYLILNDVKPEEILSITFSKASANDMKDKFNNIFGEELCNSITFSTIHSFAYSVVRYYYNYKKIKFQFIDDNVKIKFLKEAYLKNNEENNEENINDEDLDNLINKIGFVKNMMLQPVEIENYIFPDNQLIPNFKSIYLSYEKYKRNNCFIDYDDMLSECLKIFTSEPSILKKYKSVYRYIQVDEGQDTSKLQHEIIKTLAYPENNVLYVADDDQSIYGFRAAYPEFLLNIEKSYANTKILRMEENYRSSGNIVSTCNLFIKTNKKRYDKNMFTSNSEGSPIKIEDLIHSDLQYSNIINNIKNINNREVAVLYRNNRSSIIMASYLIKANIPFKMKGFDRYFFHHWILEDILSFIEFASDNKNIEAFSRIYKKLYGFYISNKMFNMAARDKNDKSVFDKLASIQGLEEYQITKINELRNKFDILSTLDPYSSIGFIESKLNYIQQLEANKERYGNSIDNQKSILSTLKMFSEGTKDYNSLKEKLETLEKNMFIAAENKSNNITLSTVHSSKGLEWDDVYIIDLIDDEFPAKKSDVEEERRLFYVGMTRAKENLALYKFYFKNDQDVTPSSFISETENIIRKSKKKSESQTYYNIMSGGITETVSTKNKILSNSIQLKQDNIKINTYEKGMSGGMTETILTNNKTLSNNVQLEQDNIKVDIYETGMLVKHKKFGEGKVKSCTSENVIVFFKNINETKKLSIEICSQNNLLEILN